MNIFSKLKYIFPVLPVFFFLSLAFAAGGEGRHSASWSDWLWRIINFSILVILLWILLKKFNLKEILDRRSEDIQKAIMDAEEAKEKARKGLEEIQLRLSQKDKELESIINIARLDGEKERAALIKEGERIGEEIILQARENIRQEIRKAKEFLREEAVNLALELAEGKIKENLKKEDQDKIFTEYLKKMTNGS